MTGVSVLGLVSAISSAQILEADKSSIDDLFHMQSSVPESVDGNGLYTVFAPNDKYLKKDADGKITGYNANAFFKDEIQKGRRAGYEESVLLKNDNKTLPLKTLNSVKLLGKRTHVPLPGVDSVSMPSVSTSPWEELLAASRPTSRMRTPSSRVPTRDNFEFKDLSLERKSDGAGAGFKMN